MTEERVTVDAEDLALCAHDLRGALTVIAGYAALLGRDTLSEQERREALAGIDTAILRADTLIGSTLAGEKTSRTAEEIVEIGPLALRSAADARAAYDRDVTVVLEGDPVVTGDALAIARVIENLLGNAAKYAPEGEIGLRVESDADHIAIEVSDRGPGIPEQEREAVLEPFARLERDATNPGTGLGLTVVKSIAERHRGRVEIFDREGGGTVVRVVLPAAPLP